jgi:hypothetical protein
MSDLGIPRYQALLGFRQLAAPMGPAAAAHAMGRGHSAAARIPRSARSPAGHRPARPSAARPPSPAPEARAARQATGRRGTAVPGATDSTASPAGVASSRPPGKGAAWPVLTAASSRTAPRATAGTDGSPRRHRRASLGPPPALPACSPASARRVKEASHELAVPEETQRAGGRQIRGTEDRRGRRERPGLETRLRPPGPPRQPEPLAIPSRRPRRFRAVMPVTCYEARREVP